MQYLKHHKIADIFQLMAESELTDLKEDIEKNGLHHPVVIYDGKILDGRNRYRACLEVGVDPKFVDYDGDDPVGYVLSLNLHRRHLNESQRGMVAARLANMQSGRRTDTEPRANLPEVSNAEAAGKLNVSERTVKSAKSVQKNGTKSLVEAVSQGDISVSAAAAAATLPNEEQEKIVEEVKSGAKPSTAVKAHVRNNSGQNEWYSPSVYLKAARRVMVEIDLDPASSEIANRSVGATEIYTKENGKPSEMAWFGNVWMNPPYAQPLIREFSDRLCLAVDNSEISQAIVLVNNATETAWFQEMAERASAICFHRKRIKFLNQEGKPGAPLQGQAFLYFGENVELFADAFKEFGFVVSHHV